MIIVGTIQPFALAQTLMVLDEGDVKEVVKTSVKDLPENICELAHKYNCSKVKIAGAKKYAKGFEDKIKNCFVAKYQTTEIPEIEYLTK